MKLKTLFLLLFTGIFGYLSLLAFNIYQIYQINHCKNKLLQVKLLAAETAVYRKKKYTFLKEQRKENSFILSSLEKKEFLQEEKSLLTNYKNNAFFKDLLSIESFYQKNKIIFDIEEKNHSPLIQESEITLNKPIFLNEKDLEKLLKFIDQDIHPLQVFFKKITIKKTLTPLKNECFELSMQLFKRDFLK